MGVNRSWEQALRAELQSASCRAYQRLTLADPWHRALTCCYTAQRIREERTRQLIVRQMPGVQFQPKAWNVAIIQAIKAARQRSTNRCLKGSWGYALKLKVTAWRMRAKTHTHGKASVLPK